MQGRQWTVSRALGRGDDIPAAKEAVAEKHGLRM